MKLLITIVAFLLFGASKVPELARALGKQWRVQEDAKGG
ncbi:twin-arginine translocase TatA/TatE family subunit [Candidatus Alkanophaga liquidiphilum]